MQLQLTLLLGVPVEMATARHYRIRSCFHADIAFIGRVLQGSLENLHAIIHELNIIGVSRLLAK